MRTTVLIGVVIALLALTGMGPALAQRAPHRSALPPTLADFDGDGYGDLAVGVPGEGVGGHFQAGAVNVIYGSADGLTSQGSQVWHQDVPGIGGRSEESDRFGSALAWGDFDGDGYGDLAVGVPQETVGDVYRAGAVNVIYGSQDGLTADGQVLITQDTLGTDQAEASDDFGDALAAADFDASGQADLAVGVPREDTQGVSNAGAVHVIYGSPTGLGAGGDHLWGQAFPGIQGEPEAHDRFGRSLAAGDFGRGGYSDLAVGVPEENLGEHLGSGVVHVFYGTGDGLTVTGNQLWHQDRPGIPGVAEAHDEFGIALAAGDFGKGSLDDLAVGVWREEVAGQPSDAGAVNVIHGAESGLTGRGAQVWHRDSDGILGPAEEDGLFGAALAAADFGHSGHDDVAIGAIGAGPAGEVSVIYGTVEGLAPANDQRFDQATIEPGSDQELGEQFGDALAAADFGRSGHADLVIGVPVERLLGNPSAGQVHVVYGSAADGLTATDDQVWHQGSPGIGGGPENSDHFGNALAASRP
jgi:hypothetical protein